MNLTFAKLCPGGNPTILITDPVPAGNRADVAAKLMAPLHLYAEQVGFMRSNKVPEPPEAGTNDGPEKAGIPRLEMMGGEFCVNATRAAAWLLAANDLLLSEYSCLTGLISVSGMPSPVAVAVAKEEADLFSYLQASAPSKDNEAGKTSDLKAAGAFANSFDKENGLLYCAAKMPCEAGVEIIPVAEHALLVRLPGISHLLLDARRHPVDTQNADSWKQAAAEWRNRANLNSLAAAGVVWWSKNSDGYSIEPAVYVKATESTHLETACGSASLAIALADGAVLTPDRDRSQGVEVKQPSGEVLRVLPAKSEGHGKTENCYWVSGPVRLVALGQTWL